MQRKITSYRAAYNQGSKYASIKFDVEPAPGRQNNFLLTNLSSSEIAAIILIVKHSNAYYDDDSKWFYNDPE